MTQTEWGGSFEPWILQTFKSDDSLYRPGQLKWSSCAYLFFWTNFPHRQTSESDIIIRWLKFPRSSFIFFKRRLYSDHYEIASKTPVLEHCCIVFHRAYALLVYHKYVLHAEKCKLLSCHQENSSYKSAILYMITTQHSKWYSFLAGGYSLALELTKDCLN